VTLSSSSLLIFVADSSSTILSGCIFAAAGREAGGGAGGEFFLQSQRSIQDGRRVRIVRLDVRDRQAVHCWISGYRFRRANYNMLL
jgi:hypothetical protein